MIIGKNTFKRDKVKEEILLRIRSGMLRINDCLPSERTLAKQMGVGRITVKNAIMELVNEGFLSRDGRRGTKIIKDFRDEKIDTPSEKKQKHILIAYYPSELPSTEDTMSLCSRTFQGVIQYADLYSDIVIIQTGEKVNSFLESSINIDGIIVNGTSLEKNIPVLKKAGVPIVIQDCPSFGLMLDSVEVDHYEAGVLSARNLNRKGSKNVMFLNTMYPRENNLQPGHRLRWKGFIDTINSDTKSFHRKIDFESLINSDKKTISQTLAFINKNAIDGIVCAIPRIHVWLKYVLSHRKKPGTDIETVVIDCSGGGGTQSEVDKIILDTTKMGLYSCKRLYELIENPRIDPMRHIIPAYEIKAAL